MRRAPRAAWFFCTLTLALTACIEDLPPVVCKTDKLCILKDETQGICLDSPESIRYCAFPDTECPSKWRWSGLSGKASKQCVDPSLIPPDGGTTDGAPDASPPG